MSNYSPSTVLLAGVAVIVIAASLFKRLSLYLTRRKFRSEHGAESLRHFYPHKDPFFGTDNIFETIKAAKESRLLDRNETNFQKYGNTFGFKIVTQNSIATSEPENIKTILSLKFKDYGLGQRMPGLGPLLGKGIFTMDGQFWSHSRAMIRPNFVKTQVADLDAFERHIQAMLKLIPQDGSTFDLQELFFRLTIDSATEFLFGESTNTLQGGKGGQDNGARFAKAFNDAQEVCATRLRLGLLRNTPLAPKGEEEIKICHDFVDKFVNDAIKYRESFDVEKEAAKPDQKYVFLHELAKDTSDKRRLRDELLNVLLAGRDTTASLLSNMWFMLAKKPEIFAKLREEIETTLNGAIPSYQELRNLKYLKYCMNESLRIHPVVPGNSRLAIEDTVLPIGGGDDGKSPLFVPKGTVIFYSAYAMHRREDFYGKDAAEYRPERWETLRPGWEYLPFNGGPRVCVGQQYALTEAGYTTVRLCQLFKSLESRDPGVWRENLTLTCCSKNGVKVGLTPA